MSQFVSLQSLKNVPHDLARVRLHLGFGSELGLWLRSESGLCQKFVHRVSKNCAKLFLSELRQIFTNFDNLWQGDGKEAKIMQGALIFYLT